MYTRLAVVAALLFAHPTQADVSDPGDGLCRCRLVGPSGTVAEFSRPRVSLMWGCSIDPVTCNLEPTSYSQTGTLEPGMYHLIATAAGEGYGYWHHSNTPGAGGSLVSFDIDLFFGVPDALPGLSLTGLTVLAVTMGAMGSWTSAPRRA